MCGIIGYIGNQEVLPVLMQGLNKLEYRGYDSAGITILDQENGNQIQISKCKGKIQDLENILEHHAGGERAYLDASKKKDELTYG